MVLTINGTNIVPYIKHEGLHFSRNDIDGLNAGRSMGDGKMIRDRVSIKDKIQVECIPLPFEDLVKIQKLIEPEFVTVRYLSPRTGTIVTTRMYSNNVVSDYKIKKKNGIEYWSGIKFPLVEE